MPRALPIENIVRSILILRGQRVILDRELAMIYGSTTKRLNEQVKRNGNRFPEDFMFQLTAEEAECSRSQIATLNRRRGQNIKSRPYAFTEHGAIQVANVLNSRRAIAMGVHVVRTFVQLRELLASNKTLLQKLNALEHKLKDHDDAIVAILSTIRELLHPRMSKRRGIGFTADLRE
ncbi:MAG: ORF6N domain-containing protein [Steroidobacteraceae bacterium]